VHERRAGERLSAVARDVAHDEGDATVVDLEGVVEVASRGQPGGGAIGHRHRQASESVGHLREEGGLQQTDVLEQLRALACEPPCPGARERVGRAQQQREDGKRRDSELDGKGDDPDDVADRLGHPRPAAALRPARPRGTCGVDR